MLQSLQLQKTQDTERKSENEQSQQPQPELTKTIQANDGTVQSTETTSLLPSVKIPNKAQIICGFMYDVVATLASTVATAGSTWVASAKTHPFYTAYGVLCVASIAMQNGLCLSDALATAPGAQRTICDMPQAAADAMLGETARRNMLLGTAAATIGALPIASRFFVRKAEEFKAAFDARREVRHAALSPSI